MIIMLDEEFDESKSGKTDKTLIEQISAIFDKKNFVAGKKNQDSNDTSEQSKYTAEKAELRAKKFVFESFIPGLENTKNLNTSFMYRINQ